MDERIQAVLDGELAPGELTPEEFARFKAAQAMLAETIDCLRSAPVPDLVADVMAALPPAVPTARAQSRDPVRSALSWLWRPRSLSIAWRPAYALAVVLALVLLRPFSFPAGEPQVLDAEAQPRLYVEFRLEAPGAASVELAGSFTGWQPGVELIEIMPGHWSALVPLAPGVHDYTYVVDGHQWVPDPYAPQVEDGFGGRNSRLFLTRPDGNV